MTTDSLAGEALAAEILGNCDRVLAEVGRRGHMFGWLRAPGAGADQWLAIDAYYPGNRMVVAFCGEHDALLSELVPAHGLRLLLLRADELGRDRDAIGVELKRRIADLPAVTRPTGALPGTSAPRESAVARAFATATAPPDRPRVRHRTRPLEPQRTEQFVAAGFLLGLVLVAVLCTEIYLGLTEAALGSGHVLLAFGIALDACTRVLGMVAAQRAAAGPWLWPCVIGGSPVVAMFALFQRSGPVDVDPAPLAGLLALLAIVVVLGALLAMLLGI